MPEWLRPDRVHFYVAGADEDEVLKVMVDHEYGNAWLGKLEDLRRGYHLLVSRGLNLTFLPGRGRAVPAKLVVDWVL